MNRGEEVLDAHGIARRKWRRQTPCRYGGRSRVDDCADAVMQCQESSVRLARGRLAGGGDRSDKAEHDTLDA